MRDPAPYPDDDSNEVPAPDHGGRSNVSLVWVLIAIIVLGLVVAMHLAGVIGPDVH